MITLQLLQIYNNYEGSGEQFVRFGSEEEKEILDYDNWVLIEEFIHDIHLLKINPGFKEFALTLQMNLVEHCEGVQTIQELMRMVNTECLKM
ncbi:MAG: hypothetical protein ABI761_03050 [Saprospiraceae bacterium]